MPSLYHFSAVDAASAVDYSRDVGIDDGVVNSPPPKLVARAYAPSPSPLSKEKRTLVRLGHLSPSRDDGVARRGPTRRLRMEGPPCHTSPAANVTPPATSTAIVGPPDAPATPPSCPPSLAWTPPKTRCLLKPQTPFAFAFLFLRVRAVIFTSAQPKPLSLFSPLYAYLPMTSFRRWLPARVVPGPPPRLPWIGTPSRPHHPSPIGVWPSAEAQDTPSRKHTRIPPTIQLPTIRERVRKYGRTTPIPAPSTKMAIAAGPKFLEPWRPPK